MAQYERKLSGLGLESPAKRLGLSLYPEQDGIRAVSGADMTQKQFERAFGLLRGYTARAAARKESKKITAEDIPEQEGEDALFWVWFDRFQRETQPSRRLVAGYNAFGALQGGFAQVETAMACWLGEPLAEKLSENIRAVRWEEGDLAEKAQPYQKPAPWTEKEWKELEQGLLRAGESIRSGTGQ